MQKISVIILHFGNKQNTLECVKSVSKLKSEKYIVFVVDNGTNTLQKKELTHIFPKVKLIKNKQNLGFSGGNNIAIKKSLKDKNIKFILLLNNDATINKNLLKTFLFNMNKNKNIGILSTIITYKSNRRKIWFAGGYLNRLFCFTRHKNLDKKVGLEIKSQTVDFITGAAMFIKREVFESIGLFDEDYFLYWEDVDFCVRAADKGYKIFCLNEPLVKHKVSSASGTEGSNRLSPVRSYYYARNPFLFMNKHRLPLMTGIVGQVFIRLPYYIFQTNNIRSAIAYCKGLLDGIRILLH